MDRKTILITILCVFVHTLKVQSKKTREEILNNLTSVSTYDRNYPAGYDAHIPSDVIAQLEITDVTSISEQKMEYKMMIYLRMQWRDKRLAFNDLANFTSIDLIGDMVDLIWTPDVYISNERKVDPHSFVKHEELAYIDPNGTVTFSMRAAMTGNCKMNLNHYPFDEQICKIRFSSYTLTSDKLLLQWSENSVLAADIDLTNYMIELDDHSEGLEKKDNRSLVGGEFSYLIASLKIVRRSKAYGSMYFAPFPVFFVIALCSFGFKDQSARVTLCTTSITTTVLQWIAIYSRLPPVWYFTYLDGWVIFHIVIIGTILMYHACWYMYMHTGKDSIDVKDIEDGNTDTNDQQKKPYFEPVNKTLTKNKVEAISASVFLILYGIACIILFYFWADLPNGRWAFAFLTILAPIVLLLLVYLVFVVLKWCISKLSICLVFIVDSYKKCCQKM
ncbi:glutamate-gated chloride channel-like [Ruditapes philippinarum]|uniref:glutamate-gated chloride channel-like n=1 Tax=Ruditapes philippinarum TaxID=129788 RepID=UPI00295BB49C|nr:glutamate-gated chloride channel-like [Ruditapes philippinarum]